MDEKESEIIWKTIQEKQKANKDAVGQDFTSIDTIGFKIDALKEEIDQSRKELTNYIAFTKMPGGVVDPKYRKYAEMKEEDVKKLEKNIINLGKAREKLKKLYSNLSPSKTEIIDPDLN